MTEACKKLTEHPWFSRFIITVILVAGVHVGVETYKGFAGQYRSFLDFLDKAIDN